MPVTACTRCAGTFDLLTGAWGGLPCATTLLAGLEGSLFAAVLVWAPVGVRACCERAVCGEDSPEVMAREGGAAVEVLCEWASVCDCVRGMAGLGGTRTPGAGGGEDKSSGACLLGGGTRLNTSAALSVCASVCPCAL